MMEYLIELTDFNNIDHLKNFFHNNGIRKYEIKRTGKNLKIYLDKESFSREEIVILKKHLSFYDIFYWSEQGIENVILWEKPSRIEAVLEEYNNFFQEIDYDAVASIEARGFILGGIFAREYQKPFIPIRKFKEIYKNMEGIKKDYINWKDRSESLFIFNHSLKGEKIIFVDDILDTGRSLKTAVNMLKEAGIETTGAFYLMDNSSQKSKGAFNFPIKSLLRFKNIFGLID